MKTIEKALKLLFIYNRKLSTNKEYKITLEIYTKQMYKQNQEILHLFTYVLCGTKQNRVASSTGDFEHTLQILGEYCKKKKKLIKRVGRTHFNTLDVRRH